MVEGTFVSGTPSRRAEIVLTGESASAAVPDKSKPNSLLFPCGELSSAIESPMPRKIHGHETDYVKLQKNYCFACGQNNPDGMRLKFTLDDERQTFVCRFKLGKRYTGPPGHCHGGIIATILDDAMGKVNKLHHVIALTKEMTVEYLKPVPLHKALHVEGREVSVHGRQHINAAEILNENNEVLARSRGTFIAIDPEKMFGKFVER
jgi:uncharacterized protein (TIGR00369 family)